ncbi:putative ribosomal protein L2, domain 2 [Helianthus anomalus]
MSDEEHQFESRADVGASKTYPQQAGIIRNDDHIVIKRTRIVLARSEVKHGDLAW